MVQLSDRARASPAIAAAGVLCVTPDAVLLRWAQTQGANTASILFWKFFFVFWFTCAWVFYVEKKSAPPEGVVKSLYERIKTGPKHFWAAVGLQISLDVLFSSGLLNYRGGSSHDLVLAECAVERDTRMRSPRRRVT